MDGLERHLHRAWKEWSVIDTKVGVANVMKPSTWESSFFPALGSNNGLGRYYAGVNTGGGAAIRGGSYNNGANAGAFSLYLPYASNITLAIIGFRCVYRP